MLEPPSGGLMPPWRLRVWQLGGSGEVLEGKEAKEEEEGDRVGAFGIC